MFSEDLVPSLHPRRNHATGAEGGLMWIRPRGVGRPDERRVHVDPIAMSIGQVALSPDAVERVRARAAEGRSTPVQFERLADALEAFRRIVEARSRLLGRVLDEAAL